MTLRFPYRQLPTRRPNWSLHGRTVRPRPIVTITLVGPGGSFAYPALLDTGADDTVFADQAVAQVGIDLDNAPTGEALGVGAALSVLRYAEVLLRLTDGQEYREWPARVGFVSTPLARPLLGFAGVLQFFTATFHGDREEVELTVNNLYPGT
jgi:hypothetical protein